MDADLRGGNACLLYSVLLNNRYSYVEQPNYYDFIASVTLMTSSFETNFSMTFKGRSKGQNSSPTYE